MNMQELSGLEIMQKMADGEIPYPEMARTVPIVFVEVERGRMVFEVVADKRHTNIFGNTHGGFSATALDTVTGCVVHTMLEAGVTYATIDLAVKMLRPTPVDTSLLAEGNIINISRSLGVSEGVIKDKAGKVFAHATATCMLLNN